ncbi:uncharacterized protein LOC120143793 isoform X3 [Hibiscus syriacus]|uniref:uncharacterized protein LOC120143793 isoform X3 n=1 Tax=Hibiscus syriacus TaxID=106335 RepID=UPI001923D858|nr:uncharacterized protein LOC120143793 isoform X3 [Hibiscus syriacus]
MSPQTALRHSKALEGLHGVQVFPHSQSALEENNKQGSFQSSHDKSFITANQPLLIQVWQQRPACLRPIRCCTQGDHNLVETVANVLTSLPFIVLGIQAPRKNFNTTLYANSLIGVGVASTLYHSSRGKLRKYLRWVDYTMIATATVVAFAKRAVNDPELRKAHDVHKMSSLLGAALFIADDMFPGTPFLHSAWHLAAAVGAGTCNKLLD